MHPAEARVRHFFGNWSAISVALGVEQGALRSIPVVNTAGLPGNLRATPAGQIGYNLGNGLPLDSVLFS